LASEIAVGTSGCFLSPEVKQMARCSETQKTRVQKDKKQKEIKRKRQVKKKEKGTEKN